MKSLHTRRFGLLLVLLIIVAVVGGCTPNAAAELVSPKLGEQLLAKEASAEVVVEPTPVPKKFTDLTPDEVVAGLPADFATALAAADPSKGETVALAAGCLGCHSLDPNEVKTGPTWHNLADTATNRRPDESPAFYIHDSIVNPGAFVVPGFPANVMPPNFADTINEGDLANLVAYLLQQHE